MDRGTWWATVHGVTKNQTWLRDNNNSNPVKSQDLDAGLSDSKNHVASCFLDPSHLHASWGHTFRGAVPPSTLEHLVDRAPGIVTADGDAAVVDDVIIHKWKDTGIVTKHWKRENKQADKGNWLSDFVCHTRWHLPPPHSRVARLPPCLLWVWHKNSQVSIKGSLFHPGPGSRLESLASFSWKSSTHCAPDPRCNSRVFLSILFLSLS